MASNVKVAVRVRPMNKNEINDNAKEIINCDNNNVSIINPLTNNVKDFSFDYVFNNSSSNTDIYNTIGTDIVNNAIEGYNCSILAYGQTGSGKTFTMLNYDNSCHNMGIIPQIANALVKLNENLPDNKEIRIVDGRKVIVLDINTFDNVHQF